MLLTFIQRCQQKYFYERNIGLGLATNFFLVHKQNVYPRLGTLLGTFYCFKLPHGANLRLHQLIINIMHSALLHHRCIIPFTTSATLTGFTYVVYRATYLMFFLIKLPNKIDNEEDSFVCRQNLERS